MSTKTVLVVAGVVLLFFLLRKKSPAPGPAAPSVPTVDYGGFGAYDFGNG